MPKHRARRAIGWGSVERQLPLMMTGVIVTILVIALVMVHATLTRSAQDVAANRLAAAAEQLATLYENAIGAAKGRLRAAATDRTVVNALIDAAADRSAAIVEDNPLDTTRVEARLGQLLSANDTAVAVELWTVDGRRVAFAGRNLRSDIAVAGGAPEARDIPVPHEGLDGLVVTDSAEIGRLYFDDGATYFWAIAPVADGSTRLGYVARQYSLSNSGQIEQLVRGLTDADVRLYIRNDNGDAWSTLRGAVAAAPARVDSTDSGLIVSRSEVGELLAVERSIAAAPLFLVLERPLDSVLANTSATLVRLALMGVLLAVVGGIMSWRVSRRFTTPLASLAGAAEAFGRGDYGARVQPKGGDELKRLAASFNRMVEEVGGSRAELEMQTAEAETARADADRTRAQAEAANRAKSDFLRVMSHELRTPLNAIGGYTELMELELRGPITEEQRRDLGRIRASQQHLLGLISGVLDLSRIESGRVSYRLESIAVDGFLSGIDDLIGPQVAAKLITLDYTPGAPGLAVLADAEKLRQIMLNLLSNAIRHTPAKGRITLSAAREDATTVGITVCDTGAGIAPDALDRIFEPFVQLDRTLTSLHEGLGLGLSISRDLARGMGGDLAVTSPAGEGACFTLRLPAARVAEGAPSRSLSGDHPAVAPRPVR